MELEKIDKSLHPSDDNMHELYRMPSKPGYWDAVTNVPCPVQGCNQTVVWWEAGYVPGYRVCIALSDGRGFESTIKHRFQADGDEENPTLIRHECCE